VSPGVVAVGKSLRAALASAGVPVAAMTSTAQRAVHEGRWREAGRLIAESVPKIFEADSVVLHEESSAEAYRLVIEGRTTLAENDLGKLFKFYYTDPSGNPDLSLATARLIVETYGGSLDFRENDGRLALELTLPLGD
jgi:hypothetical protein